MTVERRQPGFMLDQLYYFVQPDCSRLVAAGCWGYASAEALSNNVFNFCDNAAKTFPHIHFNWKQSQTYYLHTSDQYTMTVTVSDQKKGFNQSQCVEAMGAIINDWAHVLNWLVLVIEFIRLFASSPRCCMHYPSS
jgi:hypothetical protein